MVSKAPWDVVVIGLGGVGSFALRSLVRREASAGKRRRVLGLERFRVGHSRGSSHGETRIFRHAYFEHPDYVPLLRYSTDQFQRLEEEERAEDDRSEEGSESTSRVKLLERCGNLIIERRRPAPPSDEHRGGGDSAAQTHTPIIDACLISARRHSIPVELLENDDLARRFPQFEFHPRHVGLYEPGGGFVRPEEAVTAAVKDARRHGAEVRECVQVLSIEERESKSESSDTEGGCLVVIRTASEDGTEEEVIARKVIVAGGAWAGRLIPAWKPHLKVTRQVMAWIDVGTEVGGTGGSERSGSPSLCGHHPDAMPTWIRAPEPEDSLPPLYGFPTDPFSKHPGRIKIALHGRDDLVKDPENPAQRRSDVAESDLEELISSAAHFVRAIASVGRPVSSPTSGFSHPFVDAKTCLYTVSSDEHFLLGRPTGFRCTYGAAGLSGHGFKMVPALGKALADLALEGKTDMPVEFLSPSRFGV